MRVVWGNALVEGKTWVFRVAAGMVGMALLFSVEVPGGGNE